MNHSTWRAARSRRLASVPDEEREKAHEEASLAFALGQMVFDRRTELGLTQSELAARAGMKQPAISRIEGGGTVPTIPLLRRLARALDAELNISFTPRGEVAETASEPEHTDSPQHAENAVAAEEVEDPRIAAAVEHDEALLYALLYKQLGLPLPIEGSTVTDREVTDIRTAVEPLRQLVQRTGRLRRRRQEQLDVWLVGAALLHADQPAMREFMKSSHTIRVLARETSQLRSHHLHSSLESLTRHFRSLAAEVGEEADRLADA